MKQETPAFIGKTGEKATLCIRRILYLTGYWLRTVPLLSRESRCVKRDSGRSPDFRSFDVVYIYQNPLNLPISKLTVVFPANIYDRSQWRGRGGFSPRFPILRNSAPEPFVYSIVIHILYHVARFYANIFFNKKFDNAKQMWYY